MLNMLFKTPDAYESQVALWHEAGHAVVAMHMGAKVMYYGLDPLPHCLVLPWGLTKHERGVLLCAGGAMTRVIFGHEWGTGTDYQMAATLGDLEAFRMEASELVETLLPEARFLVNGRLCKLGALTLNTLTEHQGFQWEWNKPLAEIEDLGPEDPRYPALEKVVDKARMGKFMRALVVKLAEAQMKYPKLAARLSGV